MIVLKVATPATAAIVVVPPSTAPWGPVATARVTLAVDVVTVFEFASWIATCIDGEITVPVTAFAGGTMNPTLAAAPAVMLNAALTALVNPVDVAFSV